MPDSPPPGFIRDQYRMTAHLREPQAHPPPDDVPPARLRVYRDLLLGNVDASLSGCFPVLKRLYAEADWRMLVADFFARHRCHTPIYRRLPEEFLRYLETERGPRPEDPPFLRELAHYEWVELALTLADADLAPEDVLPEGDLLTGRPVLSPLAWRLTYAYPVHRIGPDDRPAAPPPSPTHLVVYRDRQDAVRFLEINALTARLLAALAADPGLTGAGALEAVARDVPELDPVDIRVGGTEILEMLRGREVILGTRCKPKHAG